MSCFKVPSEIINVLHDPALKPIDLRLYLYLCFRHGTQARGRITASLHELAADFGLFAGRSARSGLVPKSGPQCRPDTASVARALGRLEKLGFVERKRKKTKKEGFVSTQIRVAHIGSIMSPAPRFSDRDWDGVPKPL